MHTWNATPREAIEIQKKIREELRQEPIARPITRIAGADVSFNKYEKDVYAGIIVLSYPDLLPIEHALVKIEVDFPYIPGLLSFREIPPLLLVWEKITHRPDVVVVDGHGIAHPRRLGIAAHFGLAIDIPTIGFAKSILYGSYEEPGMVKGDFSYLKDPKNNERLGVVLRTKDKVKPIFVSPGHRATIADAADIALATSHKYRLPDVTRLAHNLVNSFRRGELPDQNGDGHFIYEH